MNKLGEKESRGLLRNLLFVSIISAENEEYPEEVKQEVIDRFHKAGGNVDEIDDWSWILEPLGDGARKYVDLFK